MIDIFLCRLAIGTQEYENHNTVGYVWNWMITILHYTINIFTKTKEGFYFMHLFFRQNTYIGENFSMEKEIYITGGAIS